MKKGPYNVISSKIVYENPWITVKEDHVIRPDGTKGTFGIVNYSPGVHILALDQEGNAILIKEYMYALERYDVMFPAGGIDKGETALQAAKRELLEEIGYISENWIDLGMVNPLTMVIKAPFFLFLALNCRKIKEGEPTIEVSNHTLDEVERMIDEGKITKAGTICTLYKAKEYLQKVK